MNSTRLLLPLLPWEFDIFLVEVPKGMDPKGDRKNATFNKITSSSARNVEFWHSDDAILWIINSSSIHRGDCAKRSAKGNRWQEGKYSAAINFRF